MVGGCVRGWLDICGRGRPCMCVRACRCVCTPVRVRENNRHTNTHRLDVGHGARKILGPSFIPMCCERCRRHERDRVGALMIMRWRGGAEVVVDRRLLQCSTMTRFAATLSGLWWHVRGLRQSGEWLGGDGGECLGFHVHHKTANDNRRRRVSGRVGEDCSSKGHKERTRKGGSRGGAASNLASILQPANNSIGSVCGQGKAVRLRMGRRCG